MAAAPGNGEVLALLAGHVVLPAKNKKLRRTWPEGEASPRFFEAVDRVTKVPFHASLIRGSITGGADWALVSISADEYTITHEATGTAPPLTLDLDTLSRGAPLFHWSSMRRKLCLGTLASRTHSLVTLELPDGTDFHYTRVLRVDWRGSAPFSKRGDSGSLVVTRNLGAVGMVLGGKASDRQSYVLPFDGLLPFLGDDYDRFFRK